MIEALDPYDLVLFVIGLGLLVAAWLEREVVRLPLSTPLVFLLVGIVAGLLPLGIPAPDLEADGGSIERLAEVAVIIALMGAGLKLERPPGLRSWSTTWVLLGVTMPATIAAIWLLGWWAVGLAPVAALLAGAVLAPTDPVLAGEVQVGPPLEEDGDHLVRSTLTSEAGLNDGLAFPFTNLAIIASVGGAGWLADWALIDVGYKLGVGIVGGLLVGRTLAWLMFGLPEQHRLAGKIDAFLVIALTLISYGAVELVGGYGFLAVFIAALVIRQAESRHELHRELHDFVAQLELLLTLGIVVGLGLAIADGLFAPLTLPAAAAVVVTIFLVRPVAALPLLLLRSQPLRDRASIAFFGVRGVGSIYYLAYALEREHFAEPEVLWAFVGAVIALSILVHGVAATPVMEAVDVEDEFAQG